MIAEVARRGPEFGKIRAVQEEEEMTESAEDAATETADEEIGRAHV